MGDTEMLALAAIVFMLLAFLYWLLRENGNAMSRQLDFICEECGRIRTARRTKDDETTYQIRESD